MTRPPRSLSEPLLSRAVLCKALLWYGLIEAVACLSAYFFFNWQNGWPHAPLAPEGTVAYRSATTMALAAVVAGQVGAVFCCRSDRTSLFRLGFFSNRLVLAGVAAEIVLLVALVYTPFLQNIFNTAPIGPSHWLFIVAWVPVMVILDEIRKAILRGMERRRQIVSADDAGLHPVRHD